MNILRSDEDTNDGIEDEEMSAVDAAEWDDDFTSSRFQGGKYKAKGYSTLIVFLLWVAFVIVWLFFFAEPFGPFENLGIVIASFFLLGGFVGAAWIPKGAGPGGRWRIWISIFTATGWIAFIVLWLPFFMESYTVAQNTSVFLASLLILIGSNVGAWLTVVPSSAWNVGKRPGATMAVFVIWWIFLIYWYWFQADLYTLNMNVVVLDLATMIFFAIIIGLWISFAGTINAGPGYLGIGLLYTWMIFILVWFWFLADMFMLTGYQNLAVLLLSFVVLAIIGAGVGWRRSGIAAFDFTD